MKRAREQNEELHPDAMHGEGPSTPYFRRAMDRFTTAWLFLTRVPLPGWWNAPLPDEPVESDETDKGKGMTPLAETVRAWPVVGLLVGALAGLALWAGAQLGLHPLAAAFLALIVGALVTGALHEDGLADVADGFGGGASKAKKLAIMKDSHIGAYGVLALILGIGFKAASLGGFNAPVLAVSALVGAHVLSRALLPLMMVVMEPARRGGLGRGAGAPDRDDAVVAAILGVLVALLVLGLGPGLLAAGLAVVGVASVGWLAQRQIGGFTGDVLGAAQQVAEALVLAGMAVAFRTVFYV
ncbi:adenosylcobinamide-GDP ribazoletransferase [Magnetovibrio sp.]|uniref:adenosylcobinamide-GDP ribazoletransferase n=1 Tax=Magnetovibrio sp. TaxID=2024836 RepID=UPI002F95E796